MRKRLLIAGSILITIVLMGLQVAVSHRLSTVGAELSRIQHETEQLTLENELTKAAIASHSSMLTITKKAKELGFINAAYLYLAQPPVALNK